MDYSHSPVVNVLIIYVMNVKFLEVMLLSLSIVRLVTMTIVLTVLRWLSASYATTQALATDAKYVLKGDIRDVVDKQLII
jgi:hypothetical protein